jgi:hypothetical protein
MNKTKSSHSAGEKYNVQGEIFNMKSSHNGMEAIK